MSTTNRSRARRSGGPLPRIAARLPAGSGALCGWPNHFARRRRVLFIGDNLKPRKTRRFDGPSRREAIVGVVDVLYWPLGRFPHLSLGSTPTRPTAAAKPSPFFLTRRRGLRKT